MSIRRVIYSICGMLAGTAMIVLLYLIMTKVLLPLIFG